MKFESQALKIRIKLALSRITLHMEKHLNSVYGRRKEIANLLRIDHQERAMIQTKHLIKDDFRNEALELIQDSLSDIMQSLPLISSASSNLSELEDSSMIERIKSVIWVTNRVDLPEMIEIKKMLIDKFSKSHLEKSITIDQVDPRIVFKLTNGMTSGGSVDLCHKYMQVIAENFGVEWSLPISTSTFPINSNLASNSLSFQPLLPMSPTPSSLIAVSEGESGMIAPPAYNSVSIQSSISDGSNSSNLSSLSFESPTLGTFSRNESANKNGNGNGNSNNNNETFDDITKRFEKLRQKK